MKRVLLMVGMLLVACGDSGTGGSGAGGSDAGGEAEGGSTSNMMAIGGGGSDAGGAPETGGMGGTPSTGGMGGEGGQPEGGGGAACMPAAEACDGVDNDCNDQIDEGFAAYGSDIAGAPFAPMHLARVVSSGSSFAVVDAAGFRTMSANGQQTSDVVALEPAVDIEAAWNGSAWGVVWSRSDGTGSMFRSFTAAGQPISTATIIDPAGNAGVDIVADGAEFIAIAENRIVRLTEDGDITDLVAVSVDVPHLVSVGGGFLVFDLADVATLSSALDVGAWATLPLAGIDDVVASEGNAIVLGRSAVGTEVLELDASGQQTGNAWQSVGTTTSVAVAGRLVLKNGTAHRLGADLSEVSTFDMFTADVDLAGSASIATTGSSVLAIVDVGSNSIARVTGDAICDAP